MGERFINAGVAEQNMISVAASLARQDFEVWAYSIAPFCYARPFEQIRNDVCFHRLPVKLLGNGGGYGYGVMGPTHHAIEDYGIMLTLPGMRVYAPAFDEDVEEVVDLVAENGSPTYLRLGRGEAPADWEVPQYAPWRELVSGQPETVVIAVGPLAGTFISAILDLPVESRPSLWAVTELPISNNPPPPELQARIAQAQHVVIAEEHVAHGGFGSDFALWHTTKGIALRGFQHMYARSHTYDRYGSQAFLRRKSGLDPATLIEMLEASS